MLVLVLSVVVLLLVGGCVCVFWAARGDAPRWARGVARATLLGSELARSASRNPRSQQSSGDD
ncbi:hypothetical protein OR263_36050 [Streptomyces sp. NEAU-H22]|uniref:hypothetical protein n=1 Tax=unclassified Streptomyces TaxID=2593676 RepID=UPI00225111DD|nr:MULTISPECIES: hypothetical protein [unclassified Streptomyces]MCX3292053.1 hypothetical protein [Streptomyces sp. NEAU-H22]WMD04430.1 hypothetical protein Q7C01_08495 [Streptomyces sp. FXY-T5]